MTRALLVSLVLWTLLVRCASTEDQITIRCRALCEGDAACFEMCDASED